MRAMFLCAALLGSVLAFGSGCDDGGSGGSGGTGGSGGSGGSGGAGGSGGSTSTGVTVNGCDAATAEDHTADTTTTVTQTGLEYAPKCIKIKAGSSVKFVSTFSMHPLVGGEVLDQIEDPDAASPIQPTSTGTEATFTFPDAGTFPYYCDTHSSVGMVGAVFVE